MRTVTFSESRANYAETLNRVTDDHEPVIITRAGRDPVVVISLDDYNSLVETAYLLRSPVNARRLMDSIERLEAGGGTVRELIEFEEPRAGAGTDLEHGPVPGLGWLTRRCVACDDLDEGQDEPSRPVAFDSAEEAPTVSRRALEIAATVREAYRFGVRLNRKLDSDESDIDECLAIAYELGRLEGSHGEPGLAGPPVSRASYIVGLSRSAKTGPGEAEE